MANNVCELTKELIIAFDCDDGLPSSIYNAVKDYIAIFYGDESVSQFIRYVDCTEGKYYLKPDTGLNCWQAIMSASD